MIVAALFLAVAITACICITIALAVAQESTGTDPVFWCDISRSQVSHERDAALAQIERLKIVNARLEERIKAMETAAKKPQAPEVQPDE